MLLLVVEVGSTPCKTCLIQLISSVHPSKLDAGFGDPVLRLLQNSMS